MFKRRRPRLSTETKLIIFMVVMALIYITLWALYFLGFFPGVDKAQ